MALISRRWRGGRIIIIRVRASRCGESALTPADLTTHSPQKACSRPRTATRPSRAFSHPLPEPTYAPRSADAFPADLTTHSPPKAFARPHTATRSSRALSHSLPAPTHTRRLRYARPPTPQPIPHRRPSPVPAAPPCLPLRSASGTKKRHRTVDVRCRMSRSTVIAVGHWGW